MGRLEAVDGEVGGDHEEPPYVGKRTQDFLRERSQPCAALVKAALVAHAPGVFGKPQGIGNVSCRLPRLFIVRVSGADVGHRNRVKREEQTVSCVGVESRLGNGIRDCGDVGWLVVVVLHEV